MRVFTTGATGFVGRAVVRELLAAGHGVVGLARSDASAEALANAGAEVHRGSLEDPDGLREAAAASDGVVHTAFHHDFSDFENATAMDRRAIEAVGGALVGTHRPLVIASGTGGITSGAVATEDSVPDAGSPAAARFASEQAALSFADRGVRASAVRLPPSVHGEGDHGFVPMLVEAARERGASAYPGDGSNRWPAVHRLDAAHLFRLALESAPAGARLHAVAEEGVPVRDIAEAIGDHLRVPTTSIAADAAQDHFGFLGLILCLDTPASSARTREQLGWQPERTGLLADVEGYVGALTR